MAITKYPNYLVELFRSKLKENDLDSEPNDQPIEHKAFKFFNISEDCLKLAVQLARRDVKEGNIKHEFISKVKLSKPPSHNQENKPDEDDDNYDDNDSDIQQTTRNVLKMKSKDTQIGPSSPPVHDENRKPSTRSTIIISDREAFTRLGRLKNEVMRLIGQVQTLASIEVKKKSVKNEDLTEMNRREMRVNERSNRINRLTYDLNRGTKDFLQEIKRGKRQECLKKLIHFYKESLKILKMTAMQMSDSSDPKMFARSKIFIDLIAIFSDLAFAIIELNTEQDLLSNEREPVEALTNILDFVSRNQRGGPTPHSILRQPTIMAPPSSPRSLQSFNDIVTQQQQQFHHSTPTDMAGDQFVSMDNPALHDKRHDTIVVQVFQDQTNKFQQEEQSSKVKAVDDPSSRKRILNQYLRILVERNDGLMRNELIKDEYESTDFKNVKVTDSNEGKTTKPRSRGSKINPSQRKSTDFKHQRRLKFSDKSNSRHKPIMENDVNRSKSSPLMISEKNGISNERVLNRKNKFIADGKACTTYKSSESQKKSSSLSPHEICPNCGVCLEGGLDSNQSGTMNEELLKFGSNDYGGDDEVSISDSFSTLTGQNIRILSDKLKQFEVERKKMKVKWAVKQEEEKIIAEIIGDEDVDQLLCPPSSEVQGTRGRRFIEHFEREFKKEVAMAKNIFRHPTSGDEERDFEAPYDFSQRLLQDWDRRDREFLSFQLFNGGNRDDGSSVSMPIDEIDDDRFNGSVNASHERQNNRMSSHNNDGDDYAKVTSKIMGITGIKEPVNLSVNREAACELVMKSETLKNQIKERIMQIFDDAPDIQQHNFLSSGMAKDLLEDCFHEVCNEADHVSSEIFKRVYKSELSTTNNGHNS